MKVSVKEDEKEISVARNSRVNCIVDGLSGFRVAELTQCCRGRGTHNSPLSWSPWDDWKWAAIADLPENPGPSDRVEFDGHEICIRSLFAGPMPAGNPIVSGAIVVQSKLFRATCNLFDTLIRAAQFPSVEFVLSCICELRVALGERRIMRKARFMVKLTWIDIVASKISGIL